QAAGVDVSAVRRDVRRGREHDRRRPAAHCRLHLRRDGRVDGTARKAVQGRDVDHVPGHAQSAHHAHPQDVTRTTPTVGQRASRSLTLTGKHVEIFAELTGDYNPLHFDSAFAERTRFGALVVQGGLTTGLLHALVAMDLPGPGSVFLSQDWKFTAPVYIGDTITAEAEVLSVHASKPVTELRVQVKRDDGTTVLEGVTWCYTFR